MTTYPGMYDNFSDINSKPFPAQDTTYPRKKTDKIPQKVTKVTSNKSNKYDIAKKIRRVVLCFF